MENVWRASRQTGGAGSSSGHLVPRRGRAYPRPITGRRPPITTERRSAAGATPLVASSAAAIDCYCPWMRSCGERGMTSSARSPAKAPTRGCRSVFYLACTMPTLMTPTWNARGGSPNKSLPQPNQGARCGRRHVADSNSTPRFGPRPPGSLIPPSAPQSGASAAAGQAGRARLRAAAAVRRCAGSRCGTAGRRCGTGHRWRRG